MRIAIFTDTFHPNIDGVVFSLLNKFRILTKKGHQFIVFAPKYKTDQEEIKIEGVKIVRLPSFPLPNYPEFKAVVPFYGYCSKLVKDFNPDLIHIETYSTLGWVGSRIAKRRNIPLIGTYHTVAAEFVKYLSPTNILGIDKIREKWSKSKEVKPVPQKESFFKKMIWQSTIRLYNNCDIVTTPSPAIKRELLKRGLKTEARQVSNGIDLEKFPLKNDFAKVPKRIVHGGRMSYEKRCDIILYAFKKISEKYSDVKLTFVGGGPALDYLKDLAKNLKIDVEFTGYVEHKKMGDYFRKNDVFITASPMETQGLVVLEAMASGLPAIGVNKYALPDVIHHGENGFVCRGNYFEDIAKYFSKMHDSPELFKRLRENAYEEVQKHRIDSCVGEMESTYRDLLKKVKKRKYVEDK